MLTPFNTLIHTVAYLWKRWLRKGFRPNQTRFKAVLKHMSKAAV